MKKCDDCKYHTYFKTAQEERHRRGWIGKYCKLLNEKIILSDVYTSSEKNRNSNYKCGRDAKWFEKG